LRIEPDDPTVAGDAVIGNGPEQVLPAAAWRKWSETMTGEVPRRPTFGKPHYKSPTKRCWQRGGEEKAALAASSLGMAAEAE
jgi:hypothetical protein